MTYEEYAAADLDTEVVVETYVQAKQSWWAGEVEIIDATFEIEEGSYVAAAEDVTSLLGSEDLIKHQNQFVSFKGLTVEAAGQDGDDLYFNASVNGATHTFTIESYLCDNTTDVYAAVKGLNIGDTIDMEGFLYWYEGVNPHITSVTVKQVRFAENQTLGKCGSMYLCKR